MTSARPSNPDVEAKSWSFGIGIRSVLGGKLNLAIFDDVGHNQFRILEDADCTCSKFAAGHLLTNATTTVIFHVIFTRLLIDPGSYPALRGRWELFVFLE